MAGSSEECRLFGNEGWGLQVVRGGLSFSFLIGKCYEAKRLLEKDPRSIKVWVMDTSKQVAGAALSHGLNLLASLFVTLHDSTSDECLWYFMNSLIEALLGTLLCYAMLLALEQLTKDLFKIGCLSGFYGRPPNWRVWRTQVYIWCTIVFIMKLVLFSCVVLLYRTIEVTGEAILSPLDEYPILKLTMVMVIIPITLNGAMFWITDNFLMSSYSPDSPLLDSDNASTCE